MNNNTLPRQKPQGWPKWVTGNFKTKIMAKKQMTKDEIKAALLSAGVKNLMQYGYPDVNKTNILTDDVYKAFFKSMLHDNKGKSVKDVDDVIDELLSWIN